MLVRTDPGKHRISFLSIPRDLRVDIPGYGTNKINAAFQFGGPTLALQTVKELTALGVNHVAFVDFAKFKELIDSVGGIEVDVPRPILSNRFACPYPTSARCNAWPGWHFEKGKQHMDGQRALDLLAHPREQARPVRDGLRPQQATTAGDPGDGGQADRVLDGATDAVPRRQGRQAARHRPLVPGSYFSSAGHTSAPASGKALHCRLGGEPQTVGGQSVIVGSEDNPATIAMFMGSSAPLPPPAGLPYAPVVRRRRLTPWSQSDLEDVLVPSPPPDFFSPLELLSPAEDSFGDSFEDSLSDELDSPSLPDRRASRDRSPWSRSPSP